MILLSLDTSFFHDQQADKEVGSNGSIFTQTSKLIQLQTQYMATFPKYFFPHRHTHIRTRFIYSQNSQNC